MTRIAPFTWAGYTDGSLRTTVSDCGHFLAMLLNRGAYGGRPGDETGDRGDVVPRRRKLRPCRRPGASSSGMTSRSGGRSTG